MKKQCKYCKIPVIKLDIPKDAKIMGKGLPSQYRHDPKSIIPTCGRGALTIDQVERDPTANA